MEQAAAERSAGNVQLSIDLFAGLRDRAGSPEDRARAAGELGASLLQARRHKEARDALLQAHASTRGTDRGRHAIDLGNLAVHERRLDDARVHYQEATELLAGSTDALAVALNLARIDAESARAERLRALAPRIDAIGDMRAQARLLLNLGEQARKLGEEGTALAHASLDKARQLAGRTGERRLEAEALDTLAQLYEERGRASDAQRLTLRALEIAAADELADLRFALDWRLARLHAAAGDEGRSLAAYQRAVDQLETIRPDIPIDYDDGRSSFRATFEPLYLGLADQLLRKASKAGPEERASILRRARDLAELLKQAEMQDYLGDRCEVEAIHRGARPGVHAGTAILYPIILADRTELLLETEGGIEWRTAAVRMGLMRQTARSLAAALRAGRGDFLRPAQELYGWLVRPFEDALRMHAIETVVLVPDSALRLVPLGALHDGERFVVEKLATATVTGLTMTNADPPRAGAMRSLVAGLAEPGPVVDRLPPDLVASILGTEAARSATNLRERLALPGVKEEVSALGKLLPGSTLVDGDFTVGAFEREVQSGDYRVVHIASHGVFGSTAEASYILAYDDLLTMNGLQALLRSERFRRNPIEILSLSACETAEGNDRSPLGISGAAMKARAKAVIGTLWPVEDQAARLVMEGFYTTLAGTRSNKAHALRAAQLELLHRREYSHPFFWAPFILIGNWL
jgi:CHAT domain-containing protein